MTRDPPLHPGLPILGSLLDFQGNRAHMLLRAAQRYGPVVMFRIGPRRITLLAEPDLIAEMLTRNHDHYLKETRAMKMMRDGLGRGLLTNDGPDWARQRRVTAPVFRRDNLEDFASLILAGAQTQADAWAALPDGSVLDVVPEFHRLSMRIAGHAFLGQDVGPLADRLRESFNAAITLTTKRILSPFSTPLWVPTPTNRLMLRHVHTLDTSIAGLIRARRESGSPRSA